MLPHHRHLIRHRKNGKSIWVDIFILALLAEIGVLLYGWFTH